MRSLCTALETCLFFRLNLVIIYKLHPSLAATGAQTQPHGSLCPVKSCLSDLPEYPPAQLFPTDSIQDVGSRSHWSGRNWSETRLTRVS